MLDIKSLKKTLIKNIKIRTRKNMEETCKLEVYKVEVEVDGIFTKVIIEGVVNHRFICRNNPRWVTSYKYRNKRIISKGLEGFSEMLIEKFINDYNYNH